MRAPARELTAAAAFLAFAATMAVESCSDAYRSTGAGVAHDAVFYPRLVIAAIATLSLLIGARALMALLHPAAPGAQAPGTPAPGRWAWRPAIGLVLACCGYVGLMQVAGFAIATAGFALVAPAVLGLRDLRVAALVAVLFPAGAWVLFAWVIRIPLPGGSLPWLE
ncbi:MAG: tripartite tricarboxylate transporter TctB family protein [Lautropia sp.]